MRTVTEIKSSMLAAEQHLRWASGNEASMRFRASLPGVSKAEAAHLNESADWFKGQAESARAQVCAWNDALLLLS